MAVTIQNRDTDPLLPDDVAAWMEERGWNAHHDEWHLVRQWDMIDEIARKDPSPERRQDARTTLDDATARGWARAPIQEGAAGNGLDFLAMHRAMVRLLSAEFPQHAAYFQGWNTPPTDPDDPDDPLRSTVPPQVRPFNPDKAKGIAKIENQAPSFAADDDYGLFIETSLRPLLGNPSNRSNDPQLNVHGYLHMRWAGRNSPVDLSDPSKNLGNARFWRLHGWLDRRWSQFRTAKGLSDSEPKYAERVRYYMDMMSQHHAHLAEAVVGVAGAPSQGLSRRWFVELNQL